MTWQWKVNLTLTFKTMISISWGSICNILSTSSHFRCCGVSHTVVAMSLFPLCISFSLPFLVCPSRLLLPPSSWASFFPLLAESHSKPSSRAAQPIMTCDWKWISKQSTTYHLYIAANRSIGGVFPITQAQLWVATRVHREVGETALGREGDEQWRGAGERKFEEG